MPGKGKKGGQYNAMHVCKNRKREMQRMKLPVTDGSLDMCISDAARTDGCRSEVRVREKDAIGRPSGVRLECTLSAAVKVHLGRED